MNAKAILKDIKKMLFESDDQPDAATEQADVKEEEKSEAKNEAIVEPEKEAPVEPSVAEEKIAALETKVEQVEQKLSKVVVEKQAIEAKLSKSDEDITKLIELLEQLMDTPTADPSDQPKESFKKHLAETRSQQISKFQKGFELLNNNKKV